VGIHGGERMKSIDNEVNPLNWSIYIPGKKIRWGRYEIYGEVDIENIKRLKEEGYVPVPEDKYPHLALPNSTNNEITYKGLKLMYKDEDKY